MPVSHPNTNLFPYVFNADRNLFIVSSANHSWDKDTNLWVFDDTILIKYMTERKQGESEYNQVASTSVTLNTDEVAYVILDNENDGAALTINTCLGSVLPNNDNIYVLAIRCSGLSNEPLLLRDGTFIEDDSRYNQTTGVRSLSVTNHSGVTWNVGHDLNSEDVMPLCKDTSITPPVKIEPELIEFTDSNNITITFNAAITGKCVVMKGIV